MTNSAVLAASAAAVFTKIKNHAEKIASNKPQRFPEAASDGEFFRQGDIYVWNREKMFPQGSGVTPEGFERLKEFDTQLALGFTQGARHVLDSDAGVIAFRRKEANALQGILFVTTEERTITHPEHGHLVLPASDTKHGCNAYEITFQRAYAEVLRAVRD